MKTSFRLGSSPRSHQIFDFKFYFYASQVPNNGWDSLVVFLIPADSGRAIAKTKQGHVRIGTCLWPEPIITSMVIIQDPTTKEYDEKVVTLTVSTGSLQPGVLGEATIDLTDFINTTAPSKISLPLQNCDTGTVLHVKIQCLLSSVPSRELDFEQQIYLDQEDPVSISDDNDAGSDMANNAHSGASQSLKVIKTSYGHKKDYSSDTASNATYGTRNLFRERHFSPTGSAARSIHRHELLNDQIRGPQSSGSSSTYINALTEFNQKSWHDKHARKTQHILSRVPSCVASSSGTAARMPPFLDRKDYVRADLEAAELTIKEMREDSMAWERQARKGHLEMEALKQQLNSEIKQGSELKIELSALKVECDSLKLDLEQLNMSKLALEEKEHGRQRARWEAEDAKHSLKVLQKEILDEKEANRDLTSQLHKTQQSYAQLLLAVKDLEETLGQQNSEIKRLTDANNEFAASSVLTEEKSLQDSKDEDGDSRLSCRFESEFTKKLADKDEELKQLKANYSNLQIQVRQMQLNAEVITKQLNAVETDHIQKLKEKEERIYKIMLKLSDPKSLPIMSMGGDNWEADDGFQTTIELIRTDIDELKRNCKELKEENIDLDSNIPDGSQKTIGMVYRDVHDLRRDCKELTEENIDVAHKLDPAMKESEDKTHSLIFLEERMRSLQNTSTKSGSLPNLIEDSYQKDVAENEASYTMDIAENEVLRNNLQDESNGMNENCTLLQIKFQNSLDGNELTTSQTRNVCGRNVELLSTYALLDQSSALLETHASEIKETLSRGTDEGKLSPKDVNNHVSRFIRLEGQNKRSGSQHCKMSKVAAEIQNLVDELGIRKEQVYLQHKQEVARLTENETEFQLCTVSKNRQPCESSTEVDPDFKQIKEDCTDRKVEDVQPESCDVKEQSNALLCHIEALDTAETPKNEGKQVQIRLLEAIPCQDPKRISLEENTSPRSGEETKTVVHLQTNTSNVREREQQISILSEEIQKLQNSGVEIQSDVDLAAEKDSTEKKLQDFHQENRAVTEKLHCQIAELNKTLESQQREIQVSEGRSAQLEDSKKQLEMQVTNLEAEIVTFKQTIAALEEKLKHVTDENMAYTKEKEHDGRTYMNLCDDKYNLEISFQQAISKNQKELEESQKRLKSSLEVVTLHRQARNHLAEQLGKLNNGLCSLNQSKRKTESMIEDLQISNSLIEKQLQEAKEANPSFSVQVASLKEELDCLQKTPRLQEENLQTSSFFIGQQCEEERRRSESTTDQIFLLKAGTVHSSKEPTDQEQDLQEDKDLLVSCMKETEGKNQAKFNEFHALSNEVQKLDEVLKEKSKVVSDNSVEASKTKSEKHALQMLLRQVQNELNTAQEKIHQMVMIPETNKLHIQDLENKLLDEETLNTSRTKMLELQLSALSDKRELLKISVDEIEVEVSILRVEKVMLERQLASLQQENLAIKEQFDGLMNKIRDVNSMVSLELEAKEAMETTVAELKSSKEKLEIQVTSLVGKSLEFSQKVSHLAGQIHGIVGERALYESANMDSLLDLQNLQEELGADFENLKHQDQLELFDPEKVLEFSLRKTACHCEYIGNLVRRHVNELNNEISVLQRSKRELGDNASDLQAALSFAEQQLQEVTKERSPSVAKIALMEDEMANSLRDVCHKQKGMQALIDSMIGLQEEHTACASTAEETLDAVRTNICHSFQKLQNKLQQLQEDNATSTEEKQKLCLDASLRTLELSPIKLTWKQLDKNTSERKEEASLMINKLENKTLTWNRKLNAAEKLAEYMQETCQSAQRETEKLKPIKEDSELRFRGLQEKILELDLEKEQLLNENPELETQVATYLYNQAATEDIKSRYDSIKFEKETVELLFQRFAAENVILHERNIALIEKLIASEISKNELHDLRQSKLAMEKKLSQLQSSLQAHEAAKIPETDQNHHSSSLRRLVNQILRGVEDDEEKNEFTKWLHSLEKQLMMKSDALSKGERKLKETGEVLNSQNGCLWTSQFMSPQGCSSSEGLKRMPQS